MKSVFLFAALAGAMLTVGAAPAFANGHIPTKSELEAKGYSCSISGLSLTCSHSVNGVKDLPDIVVVAPIYSTGPFATGYGPCGPGYWSSPMPGICNIAISEDMNHGRGPVITDGGTAPTCDIKSATVTLGRHGLVFTEGSSHLDSKCPPSKIFH